MYAGDELYGDDVTSGLDADASGYNLGPDPIMVKICDNCGEGVYEDQAVGPKGNHYDCGEVEPR